MDYKEHGYTTLICKYDTLDHELNNPNVCLHCGQWFWGNCWKSCLFHRVRFQGFVLHSGVSILRYFGIIRFIKKNPLFRPIWSKKLLFLGLFYPLLPIFTYRKTEILEISTYKKINFLEIIGHIIWKDKACIVCFHGPCSRDWTEYHETYMTPYLDENFEKFPFQYNQWPCAIV